MKKILLISLALVAGCCQTNRANLSKLEVGMSKEQVLDIMGKPRRTEASEKMEVLLYQTEMNYTPHNTFEKVETPLLFEDGKLIGWGRSFWDDHIKKYELRIR